MKELKLELIQRDERTVIWKVFREEEKIISGISSSFDFAKSDAITSKSSRTVYDSFFGENNWKFTSIE